MNARAEYTQKVNSGEFSQEYQAKTDGIPSGINTDSAPQHHALAV